MAQGASSSPQILFSERTLEQVLGDYEARGYRLVYSTAFLRPSQRFQSEPPGADALARLRTALASRSLALRATDDGGWLVVRAPMAVAVRGQVRDAVTGAPLQQARVSLAGQVLVTDQRGAFALHARREGALRVSHPGYHPRVVPLVSTQPTALDIAMTADAPLEELVVVSSRYRLTDDTGAGPQRLLQADLHSRAELGDDALRLVSQLPGTASLGVSARPHVRGGLQDEVLVRYNNIELLEPFHLRDFQSVFSGLNPSRIAAVDVYTGGFPSRYGNRMSGVLDIQPAAASDAPLTGELLLSLLTTSASFSGTAQQGRGDWAVSARRGNLDWVTRQVNENVGDPAYSDWSAQYRLALTPVSELDLGMLAYNDDIELTDFDTDGEIASSSYRNLYGWLQYRHQLSPALDVAAALSLGRIRHRREGFLFDEDLDNGEARMLDRRDFQVWRLQQHWRFEPDSQLRVEFGGHLQYQTGTYRYQANIQRGVLAEFLSLPIQNRISRRVTPEGVSAGLYVSGRQALSSWLALEAGLRWDLQDYGARDARQQLSPRLSVRVDLSADTQLRLSAGRFTQAEGIHELALSDGLERYQATQSADHYIVGLTREDLLPGLSLRAEYFYKRFGNAKVRFENLFNPLVLLPELASDRVRIAPSRARARGYELSLAYAPSERLSAWLSYSDGSAQDRLNGRWRARTWDQGATLNSGLQFETKRWTLSVSLQRHQGWRTTLLPDFVAENSTPELATRAERLPHFLTLNARLARTWKRRWQSLTLYLEVTNLLDRENVGALEYDVEETEDDIEPAGYLLDFSRETLLPRVPSIGLIWRF